MVPSGCGIPATPMKDSFLMSASEAFTSADTRAFASTFTFKTSPSRVFTDRIAPSAFSI